MNTSHSYHLEHSFNFAVLTLRAFYCAPDVPFFKFLSDNGLYITCVLTGTFCGGLVATCCVCTSILCQILLKNPLVTNLHLDPMFLFKLGTVTSLFLLLNPVYTPC